MSTRKKVILGILIFLVLTLVALVVIVPLLFDVAAIARRSNR